jgi:hypothetical protein
VGRADAQQVSADGLSRRCAAEGVAAGSPVGALHTRHRRPDLADEGGHLRATIRRELPVFLTRRRRGDQQRERRALRPSVIFRRMLVFNSLML